MAARFAALRTGLMVLLALWSVSGVAAVRIDFRIPQQRADQALLTFAKQAGISILFPSERVAQFTANRLYGKHSIEQGLEILLKDTALSGRFERSAGLTVIRIIEAGGEAMRPAKNKAPKTGLLYSLIAALGGEAVAAESAREAGAQLNSLEEVVVTARKRTQNLQDVPIAITALGQQQLLERGIVEFASYVRTVPSVSLEERGNQGLELKIRGVGNGTSQLSPTTAVYLGETPIIHTGRGANSSYNFRLVDIERVEVLRGPQGQLYGSNSLGGAIKNVPNRPAFDSLALLGSASGSQTSEGGGNYDGDLTLNAPLSQDVAVRLTGYVSEQSGWYDNVFAGGPTLQSLAAYAPPVLQRPNGSYAIAPGAVLPAVFPIVGAGAPATGTGILGVIPEAAAYTAPNTVTEDVNETTVYGGRLMGTWRASENFTADLMLAYEEKETDGVAWTTQVPNTPGRIPGTYGAGILQLYLTDATDYEQASPVNAPTSDEIKLANLVLEGELGFATLTSSTSYWERTEVLKNDLGIIAFSPTGVSGAVPALQSRTDNPQTFIQELRLTSSDTGPLTWLAGVFYQDIDQDFLNEQSDLSGLNFFYTERAVRNSLVGLPPPNTDVLIREAAQFEDEQFAVFGELGYDITPHWNAAVSFRWFDLEQTARRDNQGFRAGATGVTTSENSEEKFTPKFTLTWTPNDDALFYATAAQGFRTGVTNLSVPASECGVELANAGYPGGVPATEADTLWNYELGAKMTFAERLVTVNGAIFRIDWSDLQTQIFLNNFNPIPATSTCTYGVIFNIGDAVIEGAELEASLRLTNNLRLNGSFSYLDAQYDDDLPAFRIEKGEAIQGTPELQSFLSLNYDFDLLQRPMFALLEWSYVGDIAKIPSDFNTQALPFDLGDYHVLNLRAGMEVSNDVSIDLWVQNLTDEFGVTSALDLGGAVPPTAFTIRPRTAGVTVRWNF